MSVGDETDERWERRTDGTGRSVVRWKSGKRGKRGKRGVRRRMRRRM
ncbi:MAG: hypothetical protein N2V73_07450 [Candidatus Methanospirare jalkutatii]|nr:hypothetical protein [Candidatus Methanospirare jalkutatii]MCW7080401.1 hypothetical protein [Candidatus Methanospirare jalkutatii]